MNSFVSVANTNVDDLNALNDGYEYEVVSLATAHEILADNEVFKMNSEIAIVNFNERLAAVAGAVAVSVHPHAGLDVAFDSVKRLADAGQKQINIHYVVGAKSIENAYKVADAQHNDPRLASLNAIVFLSLKQKRRGTKYEYISEEQYKELVQYCLDKDVRFGFDSCSAPTFLQSVEDHANFAKFQELSEDCESTCFSSYINEHGEFFPCSFTEDWVEGGWGTGLDVLAADNFISDIWNHERTEQFRSTLIANKDHNGCRNCPAFTICGRQGFMKVMTPNGYVPATEEVVGEINCVEVK